MGVFSSSFKTPRMRITKRPAPVVLCLLMCTYRAHTITETWICHIVGRIYHSSRVRQSLVKPNIIGGAQGRVRLQQYHNLALATASPAIHGMWNSFCYYWQKGYLNRILHLVLCWAQKKTSMNLSRIPGEFVPMVGFLQAASFQQKQKEVFVHHLLRHLWLWLSFRTYLDLAKGIAQAHIACSWLLISAKGQVSTAYSPRGKSPLHPPHLGKWQIPSRATWNDATLSNSGLSQSQLASAGACWVISSCFPIFVGISNLIGIFSLRFILFFLFLVIEQGHRDIGMVIYFTVFVMQTGPRWWRLL